MDAEKRLVDLSLVKTIAEVPPGAAVIDLRFVKSLIWTPEMGRRLRELRLKENSRRPREEWLTLRSVAEETGLVRELSVSNLERGKKNGVNVDTLAAICKVIGVKIEEVISPPPSRN